MSVSVDASTWQYYTGGMFLDCTSDELDHAVLVVGYTKDYWYVKNSWGDDWGESGYIWLTRYEDPCMIADHAIISTTK